LFCVRGIDFDTLHTSNYISSFVCSCNEVHSVWGSFNYFKTSNDKNVIYNHCGTIGKYSPVLWSSHAGRQLEFWEMMVNVLIGLNIAMELHIRNTFSFITTVW